MCVALAKTKTSIHSKSKKLNLERFPPTSSSILLHIKCAYLHSYVWLRSPFAKSLVIDPLQYGYKLQKDDDDEVMKPNIMTISLPEDLPIPYKCGKDARTNVWYFARFGTISTI